MNKDNKKIFVVLTIILSLIVVILTSYLIYDKVINNDKEEIKNNDINKEENNNGNNQELTTVVGTITVDNTGDVYYVPYEKWEGSWKDWEYEINIDEEDKKVLGNYGTYTIENKTIEGYKLNLTNISSAYEIAFGQDVNTSIMFLSKEGKVSELYFNNNGSTETTITMAKDIDGYDNIVNIISGYDYHKQFNPKVAIFIDKDGKGHVYHK